MTYANLRPTVSAILLLIGVSSAAALTLERSRGIVVLGRPLDFNIQATVNAGEDASSLCLEADVYQADTLISPARVTVQLLKSSGNGLSTLRVSSATVVEEPVLTVVIRYGCLSKNSRRYVVLADPPISVSDSNANPEAGQGFNFSAPAENTRRSSPRGATVDSAEVILLAPRKKPISAVPSELAQAKRLTVPASYKNAKPRLQLEGIDPSIEVNPRLKATLELFAVPSDKSSAQRLEAAALWRVISSQSDDLRQDIQRLTALQAETVSLREASTESRLKISKLTVELKEAEKRRYENPLVFGLVAALVSLLIAIAGMRYRSKSESTEPAWWKPLRHKNDKDSLRATTEVKEGQSKKVLPQYRDPLIPLQVKPVTPLNETNHAEPAATQPNFKASESAYALLGGHGNARGVNVEELFDIQQQADFFISLGQHDQAIEVLENHIQENAQTSPLVYLDLLKLYHRQEKRTEYQDLAEVFTRFFNAEVPKFDGFKDETLGIEAYEATLSKIVLFWQTDNILKIIEDCVLRESGRTSETLDLEAYRELLLLHSVAKDLSESALAKKNIEDEESWPKVESALDTAPTVETSSINFNQTVPQKLTSSVGQDGSGVADDEGRPGAFQKPVGARIGLDIDLTSTALDRPIERVSLASKPIQLDNAASKNKSGLIEFDMDSFANGSDRKINKKVKF